MGRIGLRGDRHAHGLLTRFDRRQGEGAKTVVRPKLWGQFRDKDPLHDDGDKSPGLFSIVLLLEDISDPVAAGRAANLHGEPGAVYPNADARTQRTQLLNERAAHAKAGRDVSGVTIAHAVMANAKRRHAGLPLQPLVTRLTHYPPHVAPSNGEQYAPAVRAVGQRLELGGSDVRAASDDIIVRRVLKLDLRAVAAQSQLAMID